MTLSKIIKMNAYRNLMDKLALHPDIIERIYTPIKNRDMIKLLEFSETIDRSSAVQFAINFFIEQKTKSLSPLEKRLEKMRYAEQKAHNASEELLDS